LKSIIVWIVERRLSCAKYRW